MLMEILFFGSNVSVPILASIFIIGKGRVLMIEIVLCFIAL
jgi:hypothetical protein